jgi:hypothetical protein
MIASLSSNRATCSWVVVTKDSKFHCAFGFCGPLAHIFKAARSCQRLEKCLFYRIFLRVHIGSSFDERHLLSKLLPRWMRRISTWNFIITMTTPSKTHLAPGKPLPCHQVCVVSLESLHSSESRIFWSRIRVNCDHFQNIFWKWSKYIDIKFEYGISTHQINDHNYFNIFNFFYLFLKICLIIYKLYCAIHNIFFYYNLYQNKCCHFYYKTYGDCLFIVKCIRTYFNGFEYKLYNDCLHMLKGIITYICCH